MFMIISMTMSLPRHEALDVSPCHTGAVDVFRPLPRPATILQWWFSLLKMAQKMAVDMVLPANNHLRHTVRGDLENGTDAHDSGPKKDALLPTERLADNDGRDGTEETSHVIESCYGALKAGVADQIQR